MERPFTIGVLAKSAGCRVETIRYYERRGLIIPVGRTPSGYRLYDEDSLKRLLFIRHAKDLGFTLEEIKELLRLRIDSSSVCEKVRERTEAKLRTVERRISSLLSIRRILRGLIRACRMRRPTEDCPILRAIEDDSFKPKKEKRG